MQIPPIKNAYKNVKEACKQRLQELYPLGLPKLIKERYETELKFLKDSKYVDDFEILRLLYNEAKKCSQFLSLRGTITSSYITYLLSESILNPLPAHYYCPKCGRFETIQTKLFGIDLPASTCPNCGMDLIADGFHLPLESAWGNDGKKIISFDYNISEEFLPFAKHVLESLYPENVIAPLGIHERTKEDDIIGIKSFGYIILPTGQQIEDYPEMVTYLEDGELCLSGNLWDIENHGLHRVQLIPNPFVENLIALQRKTGFYVGEITQQNLRTLNWNDLINTMSLSKGESYFFRSLKPKTFFDMVCVDAASHNTTTGDERSFQGDYYSLPKAFDLSEFKKYPCYTREDFFDVLLELDFPREKAFDISEYIRKGKQNSGLQKFKDEFATFNLPEELQTVAKQYLYLFPRCHSAEYVLMFARLAFYAKKDSRAFSTIVYKKR